jgi:hypothetical protein
MLAGNSNSCRGPLAVIGAGIGAGGGAVTGWSVPSFKPWLARSRNFELESSVVGRAAVSRRMNTHSGNGGVTMI